MFLTVTLVGWIQKLGSQEHIRDIGAQKRQQTRKKIVWRFDLNKLFFSLHVKEKSSDCLSVCLMYSR